MTAKTVDIDVLIIGGGPSGLATAIELRRLGVTRVAVVDREEALGGVPRHTDHAGYGLRDLRRVMTGPTYAERYVHLATRAGARLHAATTATDWVGPTSVETTSRDGRIRWDARAIVLATGCRERPRSARLVAGDRPAGVLTTGSLQQLTYLYGLSPGRRAVVVGAEHVSFSAVHTLRRHGAEVVAVLTDIAEPQTYRVLQLATAGLHRVPVLTHTTLEHITGRLRVNAVQVRGPDGTRRSIACDTVVFSGDWIPDYEFARSGGVAIDSMTGAPVTDQWLRTSACGVFALGNLVHAAETADVAALSGRHAAQAIAAYVNGVPWPRTPCLQVRATPPLRWTFPRSIQPENGAPPRNRLLLRTTAFCRGGTLEVRQAGRLLHQERKRHLVPNRSISFDGRWLDDVAADSGPITVSWIAKAGG